MLLGQKLVVILPAYNAEKTLARTYAEIPMDIVDEVVLVDDHSTDRTAEVGRELGIRHVLVHPQNRGYGGNQKTCYNKALELGADLVIMLHPDYQYTPRLIESMAYLAAHKVYPVVIGSRILGKGALRGGMPLYKYVFNRMLTLTQNLLMGQKLSEYHTGYRLFTAEVLRNIPFEKNSDDFVFDNQMLAQVCFFGYEVGEVSCPTRYFDEASSINFRRSTVYGLGVLRVALMYRLQKWGLLRSPIFG
ncbi:MAG: glycosyltransferase family 2 protein [Bacteroidia bacterium]|jgi:glycosyltransferase involved in cell wall biosynthesis|nr:glycosyltransferase family 2 protein [Sphingobacteriia bacterium]